MRNPILLCTALVASACLVDAAQADPGACAGIAADGERLACYDALARTAAGAPARQPAPATGDGVAAGPAPPTAVPVPVPFAHADEVDPALGSAGWASLASRWELEPSEKHGTFRLAAHRPLYALLHATGRTNPLPHSPTRVSEDLSPLHLQHVDTKLQVSFKTKLVEDVLASDADLWFGYTQQSFWQAINSKYSSPFRESNYEPEAILVKPLRADVGPVRAAYASLALNHQSNGQGGTLSRSWNRLIGELAFSSGPATLQVRPWVRLDASSDARDDNPDIEDYMGRGELVAAYRAGRHVLTLRGRHSLRGGDHSHGSAQLDWAYRLAGTLNAHVQLFTGYGESLIDYNLRQTTVGVGLSFLD